MLYRLVNQLRRSTTQFLLLVGVFMTAFFLKSVRGESFGLLVQNVEISPAVAKIGELVRIQVTIKNVGKNAVSCNVTAFCGDCIVGTQEVDIDSKTSVPLFFELNTSSMSAGVYSIEVLVEKPPGQQKIFDLGTIPIDQNDYIAPDGIEPETVPLDQDGFVTPDFTDPNPSSTPPVYSSMLYLIPVVPAGAVSSILFLRKRRNKNQDPAIPKKQLPQMLNEILKFEKKVETEISDDKKYIC